MSLGVNREVLERRFPAVAQQLLAAPPIAYVMSDTPAPVPVVNGVQLASGYSLKRQAICQAGKVSPEHPQCWLYGIGMGALPRVLLQRPELKLGVVIMNLSVTRMVMDTTDQRDWLENERLLGMVYASQIKKAYGPFASCHADVRLADEGALPLRDRVMATLNHTFNMERFEANREADMKHVIANQAHVATDLDAARDVKKLGRPCIVVAGGPSGSAYYEWIRDEQAKGALIICTGTALNPFQRIGITPDYVCTIDPDPTQIGYFQGMDTTALAGSTLVYDPTVNPDIVEFWGGPRMVCTGLFAAGTVTHVAMSLAVELGAPDIYLVGCDFCYPGNKSHLEGGLMNYTVEGIEWRPRTVNGLGEWVTTDNAMAQYHRFAEDYIEAHKEARWWKLGKQGVTLAGAEWLSF